MFIKNAEGLKTGLADKLLELLFRMYKVEIQSSSNVFHGFPKIRYKIKIYIQQDVKRSKIQLA